MSKADREELDRVTRLFEESPFFSRRLPMLVGETVNMYKADGRPLAPLSADALDDRFRTELLAYAPDQGNRERSRTLNSIAAEYLLRRTRAPIEPEFGDYELVCLTLIGPDRPELLPDLIKAQPFALFTFGRVSAIPALAAICRVRARGYDHLTLPSEAEHDDFHWLITGRREG